MMKRFLPILSALLVLATGTEAKVKLSSLLGDGMVLQRNARVMIWGSTDRAATVQVETSWDSGHARCRWPIQYQHQ